MVAPTGGKAEQLADVTGFVKGHSRPSRDVRGSSARSNRRDARGQGASLGSNTKSASGIVVDADTAHSQRTRRYRLQVKAGELAGGRVAYCGRRRKRMADNVTVLRSSGGDLHFGGVQRCGSVHSCPVCAARIAQERRMETITALASWRAEGGWVSMLTLTLPHRAGQSLERVRGALTACTRYLNSGRDSLKALLSDYGYHGQIRASEVTHGVNGWHPHLHVLVFTRAQVPADVVDQIKGRWQDAAVSQGWAAPGWDVGATWQDGQNAAEYVNKAGTWGMAEEATMSTAKKGQGGRTPFELLQDAALGDDHAAALFAEYAAEMHGKRQLFWSRGLKDYFGINDVSDAEIVDGDDTDTADTGNDQDAPEVVAVIPADSWRLVVKYEERAEVLRAAEAGGQMAVDMVCSWLFQRYVREIRSNVTVT